MSELEHASHEKARYFFDGAGALWEYLGRYPQPSIALQRVGTAGLPISGHTRVEVDPRSPWATEWHLASREDVEGFMAKRAPIDALVARFAEGLRAKLHAAEAKHAWNNAWLRPDWRADLVRELATHIEKGDPLDVAAYAAFAWHHGWPLSPVRPEPVEGPSVDRPIAGVHGYGDWFIWPSSSPIASRGMDWLYAHKDFTSDSECDSRSGSAATLEEAQQLCDFIDDMDAQDATPEGQAANEASVARMAEKTMVLIASYDIARALHQILARQDVANTGEARDALDRFLRYHPGAIGTTATVTA